MKGGIVARSRSEVRSSWFDEPNDEEGTAAAPVIDDSLPDRVIAHDPPISNVTAPDITDRLPFIEVPETRPVAVIGTHGGAGATALTACDTELFFDCGTAWPKTERHQACILVARTSARGLQSLQTALQQWAAAETPPVDLLGVVLIADAPGKLPKPLKELMQVVTGGAPRTWQLPWDPAMRVSTDNALAMRRSNKLIRHLKILVSDNRKEHS